MSSEIYHKDDIVYEAELYQHCYPLRVLLEQYLIEHWRDWQTESTTIPVVQPYNQAHLFDAMMNMYEGDAEMVGYVIYNREVLRGVVQGTYEIDGFLPIIHYDQETHRQRVLSGDEITIPNLMVSGILEATGARCLRDDRTTKNIGMRVYKGIFEGKSVFFDDQVNGILRQSTSGSSYNFIRTFSAVSEQRAAELLDQLSHRDRRLLREIGIGYPYIQSDVSESLSRSDVAELANLLARDSSSY